MAEGFSFRPVTEEDAREIASWRYEDDYALYDPGPGVPEEMLVPENDFHTALDDAGAVVGFCCFGPEARVPGLEEEDGVLDVGGGLRPDLTGVGLGAPFLRACCLLGYARYRPREFRIAIAAFNRRAQRVAFALGFEQVGVHSTPEREFVVMQRPVATPREAAGA